ncbi:hypothetical protein K2P56_04550 [Patescibacteria group bacterium]|nr:hypothetical protein [Patescibacteria group bacterium]
MIPEKNEKKNDSITSVVTPKLMARLEKRAEYRRGGMFFLSERTKLTSVHDGVTTGGTGYENDKDLSGGSGYAAQQTRNRNMRTGISLLYGLIASVSEALEGHSVDKRRKKAPYMRP